MGAEKGVKIEKVAVFLFLPLPHLAEAKNEETEIRNGAIFRKFP